jgi:hypothetical protein
MRYAGRVESMEQIRNEFMYLVANAERGDAIWKKKKTGCTFEILKRIFSK